MVDLPAQYIIHAATSGPDGIGMQHGFKYNRKIVAPNRLSAYQSSR
jgi:hypothetical protein